MPDGSPNQRIGLSLSGGGARAIAFHVGCLRALHQCGLLSRVSVISSVSGGSVLAGLYCCRDESFDSFESRVRKLLEEGLMGRIWRSAFSMLGIKVLLSAALRLLVGFLVSLLRVLAALIPIAGLRSAIREINSEQLSRPHTRTDFFERALRDELLFGERRLADLSTQRPRLVINAADLRTQTAFRFTRDAVGSWRTGQVIDVQFHLSEAVAASAAYPILLPAIDRKFRFERDGKVEERRVLLTDGGVYDNLGVKVFDPVRPPPYAFATERVDIVIACVAEPGLPSGDSLPIFLLARLQAAFATVHRQLHTAEFGMLHSWLSAGHIKKLVMPYLGQDDSKLSGSGAPPQPLGSLRDYPVDFKPMNAQAIEGLSKRGYDQTRRLLSMYMADFNLVWPDGGSRTLSHQ